MQRITTGTRVLDKFGAGKDGWTDGDVLGGVPATDCEDAWFDAVQEEIANVIEGAGIPLNGAVMTQLRQAVKRLFGGNVTTVNAANSPFVLTADHAGLVLMDATAGGISVTLPLANVLPNLRFNFSRIDASGNVATVSRAGADTFVGGATSFALAGQGDMRSIAADGVDEWAATSSGFASNAEAQAFSSTTKAISPATLAQAFKGANQSLSANGYQKLPGGLIIQWITGSPAGGDETYNFPIAFPNAVVGAYTGARTTTAVGVLVASLSLTQAQIYTFNTATGALNGQQFYLFAIGY